ncbi:MAG: CHAP domain-containing protein [Faecousia sp.]
MAKRFISIALVFALILSAFPMWAAAEAEEYYCNGSDMYNDGTLEYFLNMDDEDKLYVMNLADKTMELVLEEHVISMVYADESLYMLVYRDGTSALVSFDLRTRSAVDMLCFSDVITSIVCRDHTLYYIENGNVVAFNPATGATQLLIDSGDVVHLYFVDYNTLRYYTEDAVTGTTYYFDGSTPETPAETRSAATRATVTYTPRLTEPATDNPYYTTWNVFDQAGYGMVDNGGNCTCYAYGRSYENLGYEPSLCTGNAGDWYQYNIDYGYYAYGSAPILGAVCVWSSSGAGHVGVVEVIDGDAVTTSESGWQSFYFRIKTRSISDTNFSGGSAYTFLGFIYVLGTSVSPGVHEHNYSTFAFFEGDHPHYSCYSCSICGDIIRDETETNYYDQCFTCNTPSQPALLNMSAAYPVGGSITFRWNATTYTTHYNLWIEKENDDGEYVKDEYISYATSGLSRTPAEGSYRVQVQSYNFNFWENDICPSTFSDWYYFTVSSQYECLVNGHTPQTQRTEPTCTEDGIVLEICTRCNTTLSETVLPATGHTVVTDAGVAATCTETGLSEGSHCSVCDVVLVPQTITAPAGHSLMEFPAVAATCEENGNLACWVCRSCGKVYADPEATEETTLADVGVIATGHKYTSVTTAATCTEDGLVVYTCACGSTYTETLEATGHTPVTDAAVAETCTSTGLTEGSHCGVCGEVIVAQEVIEATGHSYTYSDNGDGTHTVGCENCDYSEIENHTFVDDTCVCGAAEVVAPIEDSSLKFVTTAFTMGAELKFVFIMTSATATKYPTTYVDVVVNGADGETTVRYNLEDMVQYGAIYRVEFAGLAAKNMGDSFTATIHAEAADGTQYVGVSMTASIADRIKTTLRKSTATETAKTLAVDMLNYGAAAQQYFGYDTEHLVNGDLTAEELAYGTQEVPTIANTMSKTGTGTITVVTPSVTLRSKVTLNMLFNTANYTGDVSKLTYKVTDAATGEVVFTGTPVQQSGTIYKCVYDDVGAKRMRSNITIGIYDENDQLVSQVQTWSVESYIADILGRSTASDTTRGLLENMIKYGDAAAAYLG